MTPSKPSLATLLDYTGRNERRRKVKEIRRDTREPGGTGRSMTDILLIGMGYVVPTRTLRFGDYAWDLREESALYRLGYVDVAMERKTLADLRDVQRLQDQLHRMWKQAQYQAEIGSVMPLASGSDGKPWKTFFILLIDFTEDTDSGRAWKEDQILNAEMSVQTGGIKVTRCDSGLLAARIDSLYQWTQKPTHTLGE